jgi:hypothetical protein
MRQFLLCFISLALSLPILGQKRKKAQIDTLANGQSAVYPIFMSEGVIAYHYLYKGKRISENKMLWTLQHNSHKDEFKDEKHKYLVARNLRTVSFFLGAGTVFFSSLSVIGNFQARGAYGIPNSTYIKRSNNARWVMGAGVLLEFSSIYLRNLTMQHRHSLVDMYDRYSNIGTLDALPLETKPHKNYLYSNILNYVTVPEINIGYEHFISQQTSLEMYVAYKTINYMVLGLMQGPSSYNVGEYYQGPRISAGSRWYGPNKRFFGGIYAGASKFQIRNGTVIAYNLLDHLNSDRTDIDLKFSIGAQSPPSHRIRLELVGSLGLRYSNIHTTYNMRLKSSVGPEYDLFFTKTSTADLYLAPALPFTVDIVPNGTYLIPFLQIALLAGFSF